MGDPFSVLWCSLQVLEVCGLRNRIRSPRRRYSVFRRCKKALAACQVPTWMPSLLVLCPRALKHDDTRLLHTRTVSRNSATLLPQPPTCNPYTSQPLIFMLRSGSFSYDYLIFQAHSPAQSKGSKQVSKSKTKRSSLRSQRKVSGDNGAEAGQ